MRKYLRTLQTPYSGVVQLVARQPLELVILVRVQAPEPLPPALPRAHTHGCSSGRVIYSAFRWLLTEGAAPCIAGNFTHQS